MFFKACGELLNKRSVHPQGARDCSLKKVLQKTQQFFAHDNAPRVTPEALAERYEKDTRRAITFQTTPLWPP
jgi:hypothetical protein